MFQDTPPGYRRDQSHDEKLEREERSAQVLAAWIAIIMMFFVGFGVGFLVAFGIEHKFL